MKSKIFDPKALIWLFVLITTTIFFSCEKDPLENCRKDPTCEYFVCKVNGERWGAHCNSDPLFGCTPWDLQYYINTDGNISFSVKNETKKQNMKFLTRGQSVKIGENKLYKDEFIQTFFSDGVNDGCNLFIIDTLSPNTIDILNIDTQNKILRGKFYFTGKNNCGEEVKITDGEFNLPYRF